jgi:hypothetical protein
MIRSKPSIAWTVKVVARSWASRGEPFLLNWTEVAKVSVLVGETAISPFRPRRSVTSQSMPANTAKMSAPLPPKATPVARCVASSWVYAKPSWAETPSSAETSRARRLDR